MSSGCMDYATEQDAFSLVESSAPEWLREAKELGYEFPPDILKRIHDFLPGGKNYTGYWRMDENGERIPEPRELVAQRTIERKARIAALDEAEKREAKKAKEEAKLVAKNKDSLKANTAEAVRTAAEQKPGTRSSSLADTEEKTLLDLQDAKHVNLRTLIADKIVENHQKAMRNQGASKASQQELPDNMKNNPYVLKQVTDRLLRQQPSDRNHRIVTLPLDGGRIVYYDPKMNVMLILDKTDQDRSKLCRPTLEMKDKLRLQGRVNDPKNEPKNEPKKTSPDRKTPDKPKDGSKGKGPKEVAKPDFVGKATFAMSNKNVNHTFFGDKDGGGGHAGRYVKNEDGSRDQKKVGLPGKTPFPYEPDRNPKVRLGEKETAPVWDQVDIVQAAESIANNTKKDDWKYDAVHSTPTEPRFITEARFANLIIKVVVAPDSIDEHTGCAKIVTAYPVMDANTGLPIKRSPKK